MTVIYGTYLKMFTRINTIFFVGKEKSKNRFSDIYLNVVSIKRRYE